MLVRKCDEKEKVVTKTLLELKELTEHCDTYERQNHKLQKDLTLALEKLEEITQEAERYAQEATNTQKLLADSEQKREEFQIQAQETIKQFACPPFLLLIRSFSFRVQVESQSEKAGKRCRST